jgi:tetratricopeptide (TPR) repeat protein
LYLTQYLPNIESHIYVCGRYDTAAMYYSGALDLMDDIPAYATNLAAAHIMLKNWPSALAAANRSLKMDESNPKAYYRRAQALEGLGQLEAAVEAYQAGLNALPTSEALAKGLQSATERLKARLTSTDDAIAQIRKMENERQRRAAEEIKLAAASVAKEDVGFSSSHSSAQVSIAKATSREAITSPAPTYNITSAGSTAAVTVVPKTGAEFRKALRSVKRDLTAAMAYLRLVGPTRLVGLLSAGIEEEELVPILQALDAFTLGEGDGAGASAEVFGLLEGVSRAGRVTIACAMLDRRETARLQALLLRLHPSKAGNVPYSVDDWARIRVSLGV